ncbi:hypothetical protein V8C26DRAFT_410988 [Trichoderma gracile]
MRLVLGDSYACMYMDVVPFSSSVTGVHLFLRSSLSSSFLATHPLASARSLQLLLRMPPASPFTASPFDLVINPGQRAPNWPQVRLGQANQGTVLLPHLRRMYSALIPLATRDLWPDEVEQRA